MQPDSNFVNRIGFASLIAKPYTVGAVPFLVIFSSVGKQDFSVSVEQPILNLLMPNPHAYNKFSPERDVKLVFHTNLFVRSEPDRDSTITEGRVWSGPACMGAV